MTRRWLCGTVLILVTAVVVTAYEMIPPPYDSEEWIASLHESRDPALMAFLPPSLEEKHQSLKQSGHWYYRKAQKHGLPDFYIALADTVSVDSEVLIWTVFTDGYVSTMRPIHVAADSLTDSNCDTVFLTGEPWFMRWRGDIHLASDLYPDFALSIVAHHMGYREWHFYAWNGITVEYLGTLDRLTYNFAAVDLDEDGIKEIIVGTSVVTLVDMYPDYGDQLAQTAKRDELWTEPYGVLFKLKDGRYQAVDSSTSLLEHVR